MSMYIYTYIYIYIHIYTYTYTQTYVYTYIHICTYICIYTYIYIYVQIYIFMYMYMYTYTYTYIYITLSNGTDPKKSSKNLYSITIVYSHILEQNQGAQLSPPTPVPNTYFLHQGVLGHKFPRSKGSRGIISISG